MTLDGCISSRHLSHRKERFARREGQEIVTNLQALVQGAAVQCFVRLQVRWSSSCTSDLSSGYTRLRAHEGIQLTR